MNAVVVDFAIGMLFPLLAVGDERDNSMNSIAPFWDGNETWLVPGGGIDGPWSRGCFSPRRFRCSSSSSPARRGRTECFAARSPLRGITNDPSAEGYSMFRRVGRIRPVVRFLRGRALHYGPLARDDLYKFRDEIVKASVGASVSAAAGFNLLVMPLVFLFMETLARRDKRHGIRRGSRFVIASQAVRLNDGLLRVHTKPNSIPGYTRSLARWNSVHS